MQILSEDRFQRSFVKAPTNGQVPKSLPIQQPEAQPQQPPQNAQQLHITDFPVDLRLWAYLRFFVHFITFKAVMHWLWNAPKKLAIWTVYLYPKMRSLLTVLCSKRIDEEAYQKRQATCAACPFVQNVGEHQYCKACKCPQSRLSRLSFKNRFSKHYCPAQKHEGTYPKWHTLLWGMQQQGCSSCGQKGKTSKNSQ